MATRVDLAQIGVLIPRIAGRRWVVVGSAPLDRPHARIEVNEQVIAVNGGIGSVPGVVSIWFVGSKPYDRQPHLQSRWLHREMLEQASGRYVPYAVFLRQPNIASELDTIARLDGIRCTVADYSVLDKPTKRWMEGHVCGRTDDKAPCSSGILAAAVALYCEATSVRLEGFSLKPGYQYLPKKTPQAWWRDHVEADQRAIKALKLKYGDRFDASDMGA